MNEEILRRIAGEAASALAGAASQAADGAPVLPPRPSTLAPSSEIEDLKFQVERLLILTEALWGFVKEQHGIDDAELVRRMVLVDMKDGKLDGRVSKTPPTPCPKCRRVVGRHRPRCLYCGEPIAPEPFAR
jgi:hypothetical protein